MSKKYRVSCEELGFLNDLIKENGIAGSRIMSDGFDGCTINLLKDEVYNQFTKGVVEKFPAKYRDTPEIYPVIITQGTHNAC